MAKRSKYVKPAEPHILRALVVASKQVSPNFIRVTVGGDDLNRFVPMGHDQWFRMFIKRPGQTELRLPTQTSKLWYAQYLMMGKDTRPTVRNYTVREFRPVGAGLFGAGPEIDIDFVAHGDSSPASAFATNAAPGEELAMLDEGLIYNPLPEAPWQLLVGDESALPAIIGVLRSAPRDLKGHAFIEIPHADDAQDVDAPEGVEVHWLTRRIRTLFPASSRCKSSRPQRFPTSQATHSSRVSSSWPRACAGTWSTSASGPRRTSASPGSGGWARRPGEVPPAPVSGYGVWGLHNHSRPALHHDPASRVQTVWRRADAHHRRSRLQASRRLQQVLTKPVGWVNVQPRPHDGTSKAEDVCAVICHSAHAAHMRCAGHFEIRD